MKRIIALFLFVTFFIICLPYQPVKALDGKNELKLAGQAGGSTRAVTVQGNKVFAGNGMRMVVLEISNTGSLRQLGSSQTFSHYINGIAVSGNYAFLAAGSEGMYILDISNPSSPALVGHLPTKGYSEGVTVSGTIAYLSDGPGGLRLVDVTDSANPKEKGSVFFKNNYIFDAAISGNYAYLAGAGAGLLVADITLSDAPREAASLNTPGYARGIAVSEDKAYIADTWEGLRILDIKDPLHPSEAGFYKTPGQAYDVAVSEKTAYVADAFKGMRVIDISNAAQPFEISGFEAAEEHAAKLAMSDKTLFIADLNIGILAVDVSDKKQPRLSGYYSHNIPLPANVPSDIKEMESKTDIMRLIGAGIVQPGEDGLFKPEEEISKNEFEIMLALSGGKDAPEAQASDTRATYGDIITALLKTVHRYPPDGNYIKTAGQYGITMGIEFTGNAAVTREAAAVMLSRTVFQVPDAVSGMTIGKSVFGYYNEAPVCEVLDVALKGNYAFCAAGKYGLAVFDASDPMNLKQVAGCSIQGAARFILIKDQYAYAGTVNEVFTFDITDPLNPVCTSRTRNVYGANRGFTIYNNIIFSADEWSLIAISIADPAHPKVIGSILLFDNSVPGPLDAAPIGVAVKDNVAYVASSFMGLDLVDVSDPTKMKRMGAGYFAIREVEHEQTQNVFFGGNYAYVANEVSMKILDVTDIRKPVLLSSFKTKGGTCNLDIQGDTAYVVDGNSGLYAVDISNRKKPGLISAYETLGYVSQVRAKDGYLYAADGEGGLIVLNTGVSGQRQAKPSAIVPASITNYNKNSGKAFGCKPGKPYAKPEDILEERLKTTTRGYTGELVVTNTNDSGEGSLRWCIENAKKGDRIIFDTRVFNPQMPATIYLTSENLWLGRGNIAIDASNAGVVIDGSRLKAGPDSGLSIYSDNNLLKGLQIVNFKCLALAVAGNGNVIGGDRTKGSGPSGEGNVISNNEWGISVTKDDNTLVGNIVGLDAAGTKAMGNYRHGILVHGSGNIVGGSSKAYRNIISANREYGVSLMNDTSNGNIIMGNYIGTDITGTVGFGNGGHGVGIELGAYNIVVKGNLISGNGRDGILINDVGSYYNTVIGNQLDSDVSGLNRIPNYQASIHVYTPFNRIGGTLPEDRNIAKNITMAAISSNHHNLVLGNYIGTDKSGTKAIGGLVELSVEGSFTFIGGTTPEERNVIKNPGGFGIIVVSEYSFYSGNDIDAYWAVMVRKSTGNVIRNNLLKGQTGIKDSNGKDIKRAIPGNITR